MEYMLCLFWDVLKASFFALIFIVAIYFASCFVSLDVVEPNFKLLRIAYVISFFGVFLDVRKDERS